MRQIQGDSVSVENSCVQASRGVPITGDPVTTGSAIARGRFYSSKRKLLAARGPLDRPPVIGVLGGMGPFATHYFLGELLDSVRKRAGPVRDQDYPDISVRFSCSFPDRTASLEGNHARLAKLISEGLDNLRTEGCNPIVIPCISAHAFLDRGCSNEAVLDIRSVTAAWIEEFHQEATVGILGTRGARKAEVLSQFCPRNRQITLLEQEENGLMDYIYNDLKSTNPHWSHLPLKLSIESLKVRGAELIVLGCTELEAYMPANVGEFDKAVVKPLRLAADLIASTLKEECCDGKT